MTRRATDQREFETATIDAKTWRMCWVIAFGAFISGLDAAVVNLGLDSISRDLHSPLSQTQWVISGYLVALAVSLPPAAWLTRRYGSGRVWLVCLAAFTLASVLCAAAPTAAVLIVARVIQGLAGGVLIPAGQTILGQAVGPHRLGRVMGVLGVAVSAAPALGPVVGGLILHSTTWRWLFLINLPLGIITLLLAIPLVPRTPGDGAPALHWGSLALISLGLPALVLATTRLGEVGHLTIDTIAVGVAGVVTLGLFIAVSLRTRHPVLELRLFMQPLFRASALAAITSGAMVFGSGVLFALYFQLERGQDQLASGLSLAGVAIATAVTAPLCGRLIDRKGPGTIATIGGVLAASALFPMVFLDPRAPMILVQGLLMLFGVAVSLTAMPVTVAAFGAVSTEKLPNAVTQVNIMQRLGGALCGAICAILIASNSTDGFQQAYAILITAALVSTLAGFRIRSTSKSAAD